MQTQPAFLITSEKNLSIMFDFGQANEEQKKVIQHTDGPTLIIAGPGT